MQGAPSLVAASKFLRNTFESNLRFGVADKENLDMREPLRSSLSTRLSEESTPETVDRTHRQSQLPQRSCFTFGNVDFGVDGGVPPLDGHARAMIEHAMAHASLEVRNPFNTNKSGAAKLTLLTEGDVGCNKHVNGSTRTPPATEQSGRGQHRRQRQTAIRIRIGTEFDDWQLHGPTPECLEEVMAGILDVPVSDVKLTRRSSSK